MDDKTFFKRQYSSEILLSRAYWAYIEERGLETMTKSKDFLTCGFLEWIKSETDKWD